MVFVVFRRLFNVHISPFSFRRPDVRFPEFPANIRNESTKRCRTTVDGIRLDARDGATRAIGGIRTRKRAGAERNFVSNTGSDWRPKYGADFCRTLPGYADDSVE